MSDQLHRPTARGDTGVSNNLAGSSVAPAVTTGRGRGPGGQLARLGALASRCPITGCDEQIDDRYVPFPDIPEGRGVLELDLIGGGCRQGARVGGQLAIIELTSRGFVDDLVALRRDRAGIDARGNDGHSSKVAVPAAAVAPRRGPMLGLSRFWRAFAVTVPRVIFASKRRSSARPQPTERAAIDAFANDGRGVKRAVRPFTTVRWPSDAAAGLRTLDGHDSDGVPVAMPT